MKISTCLLIILFLTTGCTKELEQEIEKLNSQNSSLELQIESLEADKNSAQITIAKLEGKIESMDEINTKISNDFKKQKLENEQQVALAAQNKIEDKNKQIALLYSKIEGFLDSIEIGDTPSPSNLTQSDLNNFKSDNNKMLLDIKREVVSNLSELAMLEPKFKNVRKELIDLIFKSKKGHIEAAADFTEYLAKGYVDLREKAARLKLNYITLDSVQKTAFANTKHMDEDYNGSVWLRVMDIRKNIYKGEITSDVIISFGQVKPKGYWDNKE